jgi:hypothetical protein
MISMPDNLPDDLAALKQLLAQMQSKVVHLEEENALLRQRLFGRKSEQSVDSATLQLALFNEAESVAEPAAEEAEEDVVAPTKRRGKRKPLPADLPHPRTARARADVCLRLPQARHRRRNQRAVGNRSDADPRDQTYLQGIRLPRL